MTRARRPAADGVRTAGRMLGKELAWRWTLRHEPGPRRDVMLFASHRGGSTWLMQLAETCSGLRTLNEPFSVFQAGAAALRLPLRRGGQIASPGTADDEVRLLRYTEDLLSGRVAAGARWRFWEPDHPRRTNRVLVKELHTKGLVDWFAQHFDVQVVVLTRHPLPQSLSCSRLGWGHYVDAYLDDPGFRTRLTREQLAFAERLRRVGSELEQRVLSWTLENYVPLTLLRSRPEWLLLTYEECVLAPHRALAAFARVLDQDVAALRAAAGKPSRSTVMSSERTRAELEGGQREVLVNSWRRHVDPVEERRALQVLEVFGIPLYGSGDDLADPEALPLGTSEPMSTAGCTPARSAT